MIFFYLDTSAFVLKYFSETPGTAAMDALFQRLGQNRFALSFWATLEFYVVCDIKSKQGGTPATITSTKANFINDLTSALFLLQDVTHDRIREATAYPEKHGLSSSDSLHLATALHLGEEVKPERVIFVSADARLCIAAEREGLEVLNPRQEAQMRQKLTQLLP
jgi:predicted nucleic acid-binding protein